MLKLKKVEELLFFLTIFFLPTQLGRHFWPKFAHVYSLPIDYLSPTVYFWDLLVVGLSLVWILGRPKVNKLALNLFLFFMLTQAGSLMVSGNMGAGLVRMEQYLLSGFFGVYLASQSFETLRKRIFLPLAASILFESTLAILQFIKGGTLGLWILGERTFSISTPAIAKFDFYGREFLRPYGTFPHPNVLAAFMVLTMPLLSFWRPQADRISEKMLSLRSSMTALGVLLGGLAIILTVSRTAMVAGFVAGLLLLTKRWKMVLVLLILILSPFLFTRFWSAFNYDNLSFVRREQLSGIAWDMFSSSPIFGIGLNNFIPAASDQLPAGPSRFLQPVHNIFLLALAETGFLGLLGLLGLIGYPIFRLLKLPTTNYQLRTLLLVWAITIFLGLFDHYFLTLPQGYRMFFLIWGISFSMLELKA